jgi:DNA-directed RNA polymerase specialized sigma24 family protein
MSWLCGWLVSALRETGFPQPERTTPDAVLATPEPEAAGDDSLLADRKPPRVTKATRKKESRRQKALALRAQNRTHKEIAMELGCSLRTVASYLNDSEAQSNRH